MLIVPFTLFQIKVCIKGWRVWKYCVSFFHVWLAYTATPKTPNLGLGLGEGVATPTATNKLSLSFLWVLYESYIYNRIAKTISAWHATFKASRLLMTIQSYAQTGCRSRSRCRSAAAKNKLFASLLWVLNESYIYLRIQTKMSTWCVTLYENGMDRKKNQNWIRT